MARKHNRIAGLLGVHFMIGPAEAVNILRRRDVRKIRKAWKNYNRYKGEVWNWPEVSKTIRDGALRLAKML